jgi:hypothetical protein
LRSAFKRAQTSPLTGKVKIMNENIANMPAEFQLLPTAMGSTSEIEFDPESLPVDTLLAADVEVTELESLEPVSVIEEVA